MKEEKGFCFKNITLNERTVRRMKGRMTGKRYSRIYLNKIRFLGRLGYICHYIAYDFSFIIVRAMMRILLALN